MSTAAISINKTKESSRTVKILKKVLLYAVCIIFVFISLVPIYLLVIHATKATGEIMTGIGFIPGGKLFENFKLLNSIIKETGIPLLRVFFNSVFVSTATVILSVGFSALFAYTFHVYDFKLKKPFFAFVMFIIMMPNQLGLIGFYQLMIKLNMLDSYVPLILPSIVSASTIFFLTQYYKINLSKEIIEAARVDGEKEILIFFKIAVPMVMPALATMGIAIFISSWNAFSIPNIIITGNSLKTLPLIISQIKAIGMDKDHLAYGSVYLVILISVLPLILVFLIFSKKIVAGTALGGVKE